MRNRNNCCQEDARGARTAVEDLAPQGREIPDRMAGGVPSPDRSERPERPLYRPDCDIAETQDQFILILDMPGVGPDGVDVEVEPGHLRVRGQARTRPVSACCGAACEFAPGDYERSFRIGEDIDPERVTAEIVNGVLTVTLAKREQARPRKVTVGRGATAPNPPAARPR
ncbi:MAG TPA: Hsp20/alpha crystallin family protein [Phycisphaerales bacterium]|nr:Hsp20/alpha crystallin family protein [Phycisphaerales bacterium]